MGIVSYAQNFEDVMLHRVFGGVHYGFYVDIGAYDPVSDSVTKAFYDRGWDGINVEPGFLFDKLAEARPRDINLKLAVYDRQGEITFAQHDTTYAGLSFVQDTDSPPAGPGTIELHRVPCDTLTNILARHAPKRPINFMKIDVEGAEAAIIHSTDWRTIRPTVLVIEATVPRSNLLDNGDWEPRLLEQGYVRAYFDGLNCFYIPEERLDLLRHFEVPVNVLDGYERPNPQLAAAEKRAYDAYHTDIPGLLSEIAQRDDQVARQGAEVDRLRAEVARLEAEVARLSQAERDGTDEAARLRHVGHHAELLAGRFRVAALRLDTELASLRAALDNSQAELADVRGVHRRADEIIAELLSQRAALQSGHAALQDRLQQARVELAEMSGSIWWKAAQRLRATVHLLPPPVRRLARHGVKAAWWAVTPWRIPARLRWRRTRLQMSQAAPELPASETPLTPAPPTPAPPSPLPPPPVPLPGSVAPSPAIIDVAVPEGDVPSTLDWFDTVSPEVSIVVVNWNRGSMTRLCLEHVLQNTAGHRYEVLVVDNGSDPADLAVLREYVPLARIVALGTNTYFGQANNVGAKAAIGTYICFLGNAALVRPGWLQPLVAALRDDPTAGAAGPCFHGPEGACGEVAGLTMDQPCGSLTHPVGYLSADCVVLRRADFLRVEGFDLAWDPAFCLKLRQLGLQTVYCPASVVTQIEGAANAAEDNPSHLSAAP